MYDSLGQDWYCYFAGHDLTAVPNRLDQDFESVAKKHDVFVITGGDDRLVRHRTEVRLATEFVKQKKPIVGVCHGAFLLTDLLGGEVGHKDGHRNTLHQVVYREQSHTVNSFHGLSIVKAPESAEVLATDADGDCEAWIDGMIAAVVWHPERMTDPWLPDEIHKLIGI